MKLVIAEKPSVGMAYAAVLGAKKRMDGYMEGGGWLVSWCFGHLVELAGAETYDERYAKWRRPSHRPRPVAHEGRAREEKAVYHSKGAHGARGRDRDRQRL